MTRDAVESPRRGRRYRSLRGRDSFSRIFQEGSRRRGGEVVVYTAPGAPGPPQVGFVAGKRVGGAVERNRAKRRLRAAVDQAPLRDDTAYVIVAGPAVVDMAFDRLVRWVAKAVTEEPQAQKENRG